jgi:hypothetical protein
VAATAVESADLEAREVDAGEVDARAPLIALVRLDALACGASGLALPAAAPLLAGALGIPAAVLVALGLLLLECSGVLALLTRRGAPAAGVKAVIAGNAA